AQLVAGRVADRAPTAVVVASGSALLGVGAIALAISADLPRVVAAGAILGLGGGTTIIGANVAVARVFAPHSMSALNGANALFGVGALFGPFIAGTSLAVGGSALAALSVGGALALGLAAPALVAVPPLSPPDDPPAESKPRGFGSPLLWLFAALLFWYVGLETSVGGWTAVYLGRTTGLDAATGAFVAAAYWAALAAGRVAGALLGRRLGPGRLLRLSAIGCVVGATLLLIGHGSLPLTLAAILLLGFWFGPIYPTTLGLVVMLFRQSSGAAVGVVTALGSVGGMLLPVAQGIALDRAGTFAGAMFIAGGVLAMLGFDLVRSRGGWKA
ncbi:MAG: MFS transporter, partial [Dehalococcoidia bacterium]|nr:MFS transporter [Dehalococcoidia bacterium]